MAPCEEKAGADAGVAAGPLTPTELEGSTSRPDAGWWM